MADFDYLLALELQSQFDGEFVNGRIDSKRGLSVLVEDNDVSPSKRSKLGTLSDPQWEVIDPTPDIYSLFMNFNKRFFWNTLGSVEVRWSPRMYSCAGVCVYEGRNGLCSVRLSEPLLKLRPRSDLVETLLHEMIHAYLFVTHNNRDRSGHGPEFQKHMNRINLTAGTKITVYHNFHDEVRSYQKHWWRCDGPCKFKPPFFGMVKRSMNRAPGPNDFWWTTHQVSCGGTFIKVRDPKQDAANSKKETIVVKKAPDIRRYAVHSPKNTMFGLNDKNGSARGAVKKLISSPSTASRSIPTKITGLKHLDIEKLNCIDYSDSGCKMKSVSKKSPSTGNTFLNKGTGVLTITTKSDNYRTNKSELFSPFSGKGNTLGGGSLPCNTPGWKPISSLLVHFSDTGSRTGINPSAGDNTRKTITPDKYKDNFFNESLSDSELAVIEPDGSSSSGIEDVTVSCPVCDMKTDRDNMQIHLQSCDILNETLESMNNSSVLEVSDDDDDNGYKFNERNMVPCPCCSKSITETDINKHLDECLSLLAIKEFEKDW